MTEAKQVVDDALRLGRLVIDDLLNFAQMNEAAESIITEIADFIEILVNMGLEFMVFNFADKPSAAKQLRWMMDTTINIY